MYTITVFKELIDKYPTWDELKLYLTSEEGGYIDIVDESNDSDICIIKYNKDTSIFGLDHVRWFRSVIWNKVLNKPVCVSPPRSVPEYGKLQSKETFTESDESIPKRLYRSMLCQKFMDGTMMNLFQRNRDCPVELTSRSKIGATGRFYSTKAFNELFEDCLAKINMSATNLNGFMDLVRTNFNKDDTSGDAAFCSFVMQHPDNRIIVKVTDPKLYIVHIGVVTSDGNVIMSENVAEWSNEFRAFVLSNHIDIPMAIEPLSTSETVEDWVQQYSETNTIEQGLVIHDGVGGRMKIRTREYETLKRWRGNTNRDTVRYVQLWQSGEVQYYLRHFPEDTQKFKDCENIVKREVTDLYNLYVKVHIQKSLSIDIVDKRYRPHLFALHGMYLQELRPMGLRIREKDVEKYLEKLPWQRVVFLINHANEHFVNTIPTYANVVTRLNNNA
jgi:hypothetical protein